MLWSGYNSSAQDLSYSESNSLSKFDVILFTGQRNFLFQNAEEQPHLCFLVFQLPAPLFHFLFLPPSPNPLSNLHKPVFSLPFSFSPFFSSLAEHSRLPFSLFFLFLSVSFLFPSVFLSRSFLYSRQGQYTRRSEEISTELEVGVFFFSSLEFLSS
ncbi:hypothetical protein I3843_03G142300 [Carya illinoinensis]|nr:hypothetical protein I3843_03G142300 [Carya illinoinensis]